MNHARSEYTIFNIKKVEDRLSNILETRTFYLIISGIKPFEEILTTSYSILKNATNRFSNTNRTER